MTQNDQSSSQESRRSADVGVRFAAFLAIAWERFWPMAIPAACVLLAFASISWLGLWPQLPNAARFAGLGFFAVMFFLACWKLRSFRFPHAAEISRRVEQSSRLEHRPLTAQSDPIAFGGGDKLAEALWSEHKSRMAQKLGNLTGGTAHTDGNRTDPWALRAFLAAAAFAAFGFSYGPQGGRISDAFSVRIDTAEVLSRLDAWVNPPAYTRKPPVYLTGQQQQDVAQIYSVPAGSDLFLRFVGDNKVSAQFVPDNGGPTLMLAAPAEATDGGVVPVVAKPSESGNAIAEFAAKISESGTVKFNLGATPIAQWKIEVVPDAPPAIAMTEPPSAALSGSLQLAYEVSDDYGVTAARGIITTQDAQSPDARPLVEAPELPLALPRQRATSGKAKVNRDLTQHPWAGGKIVLTLEATDDAGQKGLSAPHTMALPGRQFNNPLAKALIEQRRILALDANKQQRVADLLDATLTAPEEFIKSPAAYIAMKSAWRRIVDARNDDTLRSSLDLLWEIALAIEFGDLTAAERALREAQEKLSQALERNAPDEEIQKLMQELRQAMNEMMEQLMREAMENPSRQSPLDQNPMARTLRQRDLEKMLDRIEDLAKSGSKDAARQLLSEMQRMMDNLRAGRNQQQRQAENSEMNQALDQLSELMRQQQQLLDETFRMQQQQNRQQGEQQKNGEQQQGQQQEGRQPDGKPQNGGPMTPEEFAEALKKLQEQQEALQKQLGELGETLEGMGMEPSEGFGEAGREMGEAGKNLGQGNAGEATGNQGEALEALRQGVQQMMQQMARGNQPGGQQQGEGEGGQDRQRSDPLGRSQQAEGLDEGDDTKVPDEIEAQRAREIMEAIRRRLGQADGPLIEKRYLERLLEAQ